MGRMSRIGWELYRQSLPGAPQPSHLHVIADACDSPGQFMVVTHPTGDEGAKPGGMAGAPLMAEENR